MTNQMTGPVDVDVASGLSVRLYSQVDPYLVSSVRLQLTGSVLSIVLHRVTYFSFGAMFGDALEAR